MVDPDPDDPTPGPGPDDPTPEPEPEPKENLTATFSADSYDLGAATVSLKATLARSDGDLTADDKAGWTIVDESGTLVQSGNASVTNAGVATVKVARANATSLATGSTTVKLQQDGAIYATVTVNYKPSATITTDDADHLITDEVETITSLKINGTEVNIADYIITSTDTAVATINNDKITSVIAGPVVFEVAEKTAPDVKATTKMTFCTPVAKVGDTYYKTLAKAFANIQNGETITLAENLTESIAFSGKAPRATDFKITVDLNGKTWSAPANKDYALRVDYGEVTLKDSTGEGGVTYGKNFAFMVGHVAADYTSKLILDGGKYTGKTSVVQVGLPGGSGANYKYYGGDLVIKNGEFVAVPDTDETYDANGNFKYLLNMLDMVESKYAGGIYSPSTISVEGGRFYKFNPEDNVAEGPNTNFTADGYAATKDGDWYVVDEVNAEP